jgi:putative endonuclease
MAITARKKLGNAGEAKAAHYLKKQGYKILKRNYRCPFGEVDIVAQKGDMVAFIEVKTRTSDAFSRPADAVGYERRQRYVRSAKYWFAGRVMDVNVRFDIIEVLPESLNHIINAFEP